ncbi:hypothetical protein D9599_28430 [Roseomonas sp. KE2513]|uniref:TA system antitoxin ParD family protein n=1 Tax=Roseomonas sp. KE2513 TaxID=2479202 RepID=UPI0018DF7AF1|nr:hypothetical protein [Roseomonas sp. KE2513]MBI0539447.1 hypothetical protein [Roseomonas sp. KE2513]
MPTIQQTVEIDGTLVEAAEQEGCLLNRSTAAQIEHWIRLGRLFEQTSGSSLTKIRQALAGEITIDDFTEMETELFFANLGTSMQTPTQAERDFYASLPPEAPGISQAELYGDTPSHSDQRGTSAGR